LGLITSLFDRLVKSFSVFRLLAVSLLARVIALFLLPATPSSLGSDEGTYGLLASWISRSANVESFPGYGPGLYNSSKTLILPSSLLIKFGVDQLTAIRLVSLLFGILSVFIFTQLVLHLLNVQKLSELRDKGSQAFTLAGLLFFAFFPSNFLWSILGLRETASQAMTLCGFFLVLKLINFDSNSLRSKQSIILTLLAITAIALSFGARRQTAMVFVLFFYLAFILANLRQKIAVASMVIVLGTSIGLIYSTTPQSRGSNEFVWAPSESPPTISGTEGPAPVATGTEGPAPVATGTEGPAPVATGTEGPAPTSSNPSASELCRQDGQVEATGSGTRVCKQVDKEKRLSPSDVIQQVPVASLDQLAFKRDIGRGDSATALPATKCITIVDEKTKKNLNGNPSSYSKLLCSIGELPYRMFSILFRPIVGIDELSLFTSLASVENFVWVFLMLGFLGSVFISVFRKIHISTVIPMFIFVSAFTSLSALYEGNLGTAFRHKSTILWCLILVVLLVFNNRTRKTHEQIVKT